jgi:hypothetical protein
MKCHDVCISLICIDVISISEIRGNMVHHIQLIALRFSENIVLKKKCSNNKKEIYDDKYRHTRNRLFGQLSK